MTNFNVSRMPPAGPCCWMLALASGPFVLLLACSVYDDALVGGPTTAGAGGSSNAEAGTTPGGVSNKSGAAGADVGGASAGQSARGGGASSGETHVGSAGLAGTSAGGTASGGGEAAGGGAGGQPTGEGSLVDDMEDADPQIAVAAGRNGFWYVGNDATVGGTQEPPSTAFAMFELTPGENGDSTYSAHMKVSGFKGWGSLIGFNLVESQGLKPYDASAYCGLRFWGKAATPTVLRLAAPDGDTHPAGQVCVETGASDQLCHNHFGAPVSLTTAWKSSTVMFASLEQVGIGYRPPDHAFKPDQLYALEWTLPGGSLGKAYEIWIDDITFLSCP